MTEEFDRLSNGTQFADADAEGFEDLETYIEFTGQFTQLASEELEIEIGDAEEGKVIVLVNDQEVELSYDIDDEWFAPEYITPLNLHLKQNEQTNRRFCFVEPYGLHNADQGVKIAFIDKALFETLVNSRHIRESDNEGNTHFD